MDCGQCGEEQQGALHILKDEGDGCNRLLWHILNLDEVGCGEEQQGVLHIQNLDEDDCNRVLCILNLDEVDCGEEQQAVHILNLDEVGCRRVTPGGEFQLPALYSPLLWARDAQAPSLGIR